MRIVFWNTNRNEDINEYVEQLVRDYDIDLWINESLRQESKEVS